MRGEIQGGRRHVGVPTGSVLPKTHLHPGVSGGNLQKGVQIRLRPRPRPAGDLRPAEPGRPPRAASPALQDRGSGLLPSAMPTWLQDTRTGSGRAEPSDLGSERCGRDALRELWSRWPCGPPIGSLVPADAPRTTAFTAVVPTALATRHLPGLFCVVPSVSSDSRTRSLRYRVSSPNMNLPCHHRQLTVQRVTALRGRGISRGCLPHAPSLVGRVDQRRRAP